MADATFSSTLTALKNSVRLNVSLNRGFDIATADGVLYHANYSVTDTTDPLDQSHALDFGQMAGTPAAIVLINRDTQYYITVDVIEACTNNFVRLHPEATSSPKLNYMIIPPNTAVTSWYALVESPGPANLEIVAIES
jgi:hypothetical protein